jgi:hypothetical protein
MLLLFFKVNYSLACLLIQTFKYYQHYLILITCRNEYFKLTCLPNEDVQDHDVCTIRANFCMVDSFGFGLHTKLGRLEFGVELSVCILAICTHRRQLTNEDFKPRLPLFIPWNHNLTKLPHITMYVSLLGLVKSRRHWGGL